MSKSSTSRQAKWFFPIRGLHLTDEKERTQPPLFPQGDLWTKEETVSYLQKVKYQSPDFINQLNATQWDACIIVNNRSPIFLSDEPFDPFTTPHPSQIARAIASEYLSALHFCVMTNASAQYRCIFADTLPPYARWDIAHDISEEQLTEQKPGMDMGNPVERTREQLTRQFGDVRQSALLSVHFDEKSAPLKAKDVRKALASSTLYLNNSCHQWSETERLLTAVTAIEMLMSSDAADSNYSKLQERIAALLGSQLSSELQIAETFKSRHRYVHHGENCASSKKALLLAATCQVNFVNLAVQFQGQTLPQGLGIRDASLQYLDLLSQQEKVSWMQLKSSETFDAVRLYDLAIN